MSSVAEIFSDAQRSPVGHKTLAKRLRRLENTPNFEAHIKQCIFRLLDVSKSEIAGNRVIKFLTVYFDSADGSERTTSSILLSLLPYLCAKDKTVRYRATQITSQVLGVLGTIDDDLYKVIRHELIKRLRDKVPAIRLEAVMALGRCVENEMDDEEEEQDSDEDVAPGLLDKLLDVLQNDTNADVRRALLKLRVTPKTLPYLLERARDRDGPTRRTLYSHVLTELGDFRHLSMSMREKLLRWGLRDRDEKVRKAAARLFREHWIEDCAASRAEETIVDNGEGDEPPKPKKVGFYKPSIPALVELLERIDTLNTGNETGIAREAMKEFWAGRRDYREAIAFDDEFWETLTPESAFMARTFNDYCLLDPECHSMLEDKMPEVTWLGFHLQKHINELLLKVQSANESDTDEKVAEQAEQEFVVEQLLYIAQTLDYTDEVGRRKMFSLLRHALSMADLPEECTRLAVEALRLVCNPDAAGEREFTSVVLEAIAEVHDNIATSDLDDDAEENEEDSFVSARSEVSGDSSDSTPRNTKTKPNKRTKNLSEEEQEAHAIKEIVINMKCLHIAQCMLQNVAGNLQSNVHLRSMFDNLVIPAVRSHEVLIRERGVQCLGLCCLLEPKLADENMRLFTHLLKKGHETLQVMALQILCDILLARGPTAGSQEASSAFASASAPNPGDGVGAAEVEATQQHNTNTNMPSLLSPFIKALAHSFPDEVRLTATTSLCKLMLCGFYKDNEELFDQIVERAIQVAAKGWELLEKVKNAVMVDRPKDKLAVDKERERDSSGVMMPPAITTMRISTGSTGDGKVSGEGVD